MQNTFLEVCRCVGRKHALRQKERKDNKKYIDVRTETVEEFVKRKGKKAIQVINIKRIIANNPEFYTNYGSWKETDRMRTKNK